MNETSVDSPPPAVRVHYEVAGAVATVTLDSPHNRNALSRALVGGLVDALRRADADDAVRVVVIAATGSVFCSGADLSEAGAGSMEEGAQAIVDLQRQILTLGKPVVCRLQGAVRAGGTGIVAAADVAIAAERATFALTEVRLGLAPAAISLTVLPRMTSRAAALTALGGEPFGAREAAAMGLVTEVVPDAELDARVAAVVATLAAGALQGLRETKALLVREIVADLDARGADLAALSARLFASDEAKAAMTAFLTRGR
ncbi:enoyl-CoA hydratase/isomerase family protein [Nocardioides sp. TRM66260-LWL]|uniref:enoyl-CoA hydratase-related protein n=1 Tax=Nocardioides sp. TRM66260-LWL TaxID=2874478 RepID=UPI001CC6753B|nr:enoyl-CoA hydratase-related protein [Nocardioides sp. TRM66260-LWL]MBZ5735996.1 enoyl-CoA hydratase/isomerase family protein [Nocardioides sp. TRM66260-LWL]